MSKEQSEGMALEEKARLIPEIKSQPFKRTNAMRRNTTTRRLLPASVQKSSIAERVGNTTRKQGELPDSQIKLEQITPVLLSELNSPRKQAMQNVSSNGATKNTPIRSAFKRVKRAFSPERKYIDDDMTKPLLRDDAGGEEAVKRVSKVTPVVDGEEAGLLDAVETRSIPTTNADKGDGNIPLKRQPPRAPPLRVPLLSRLKKSIIPEPGLAYTRLMNDIEDQADSKDVVIEFKPKDNATDKLQLLSGMDNSSSGNKEKQAGANAKLLAKLRNPKVQSAAVNVFVVLVLVPVVLLTIAALIMNAVTTSEIKKRYELGKRTSQACGREYLEAETEKYALYESLASKNTRMAQLSLTSLLLIRIAMMLMLLTAAGLVFSMKVKKSLSIMLTMLVLVAAAFMWLAISLRAKADEGRMFYATNKDDAAKKLSAYRGLLITPAVLIVVACLGMGIWVALGINAISEQSPSDANALVNMLMMLGGTIMAWLLLFVLSYKHGTEFSSVVAAAHVDYMGTLISGQNRLKEVVTNLYKTYMPPDGARDASVLGRIGAEVKARLLRQFGGSIRGLDNAVGDDRVLVDERSSSIAGNVLWKYALHQDGKELEDILLYVESAIPIEEGVEQDAALVAYRETLTKNIKDLRKAMRDIRGDRTVDAKVQRYSRSLSGILYAIAAIVLFLGFHKMYMVNAGRTTMIAAIILLLLVVFATYYGWINSAIKL